MTENENSPDINDVFDELFLAEERIIEKSYEEGFKEGQQQGNPEGYHLGYHRGAELGAELGYYLGVIESITIDNQGEKVIKLLGSLKEQILQYPKENLEVDLLHQAYAIRSNYKRLASLLKLDVGYPEADKLNF